MNGLLKVSKYCHGQRLLACNVGARRLMLTLRLSSKPSAPLKSRIVIELEIKADLFLLRNSKLLPSFLTDLVHREIPKSCSCYDQTVFAPFLESVSKLFCSYLPEYFVCQRPRLADLQERSRCRAHYIQT